MCSQQIKQRDALWLEKTNHIIGAFTAENERLRAALKNLIGASGHMSPFGGEASVKAVRRAGKYMEALEAAQAALDEAD